MIGPTCPTCGRVGHPTHAVGLFGTIGTAPMYRAAYDGAPLRATRAEAQADQCAWQARRRPPTDTTPPAPREQAPTATPEPSEPAPFPAATIEDAARAKAWRDFLAQVRLSLMVWQIDGEVRDGCEHVLAWMRCCRDELDALMPAQGVLL